MAIEKELLDRARQENGLLFLATLGILFLEY